jgi:LytS/YehU family sensor histidine kinase
MLIKLSEDWFHFNRNENRELRLKNQQIETQLSNLRAQINPHFLFNSLNVIYALAIEKKEGITEAIVQLSDILRYIIYDSNTKNITLKEEVTLLENYIQFQKFRVHGFNTIIFNKTIKDENSKLYPMLLLPLVENSFKHGLKGKLKDTFITIDLYQEHHSFRFSIENNAPFGNDDEASQYSGVGLEHIKNNLNLVYPKQHKFNITKTETTFKVDIEITLNTLTNDY